MICILKAGPVKLVDQEVPELTEGKGPINCALCRSLISDLFTGFANGSTNEEIAAGIGQKCVTLNLYTFNVCNGTAALAMVF